MKTQFDLWRKYCTETVPMAEAAGIEPWGCVKCLGAVFDRHPTFEAPVADYAFALTVLEKRPVFVGDEFYSSTGTKFKIKEFTDKFNFEWCTWTPPTKKSTFMLNGCEFNSPSKEGDYVITIYGAGRAKFYFQGSESFGRVYDAITNMLTIASHKE